MEKMLVAEDEVAEEAVVADRPTSSDLRQLAGDLKLKWRAKFWSRGWNS